MAVVGKGLTFDSGGYNLKVHGGIELMKFDMGGAAAMLGAARIIAGIQPPGVEVSMAAVEGCLVKLVCILLCIVLPFFLLWRFVRFCCCCNA